MVTYHFKTCHLSFKVFLREKIEASPLVFELFLKYAIDLQWRETKLLELTNGTNVSEAIYLRTKEQYKIL